MSFDQNMIIDATSGSIARFVNHSCNPNCRMIKWIVSGQPRMALFAGDKPIQTGDELTYDYNFDPFSAKNVQSCLCGEPNCRGVLGPKSREPKPTKPDLKSAVKATVKAGKRKFMELMGDEEPEAGDAKKRKIQAATGVKGSLSTGSSNVIKTTAAALKRSMSTMTVNAKATLGSKQSFSGKASASASAMVRQKAANRLATYGKSVGSRAEGLSSRSSSLTIVAMGDEGASKGVRTSPRSKQSSRMISAGSYDGVKSLRIATPRKVSAGLGGVRARKPFIKAVASPRRGMELPRGSEIRVVTE